MKSGRCGDGCGRSVARGSGGVRDRVCGFMHRDEGAEHRKTGERETAGNTPVWNKSPEYYTEDRQGGRKFLPLEVREDAGKSGFSFI